MFNSYIVVAINFIVVDPDNFDTAVDTVDSLNVDKSANLLVLLVVLTFMLIRMLLMLIMLFTVVNNFIFCC